MKTLRRVYLIKETEHVSQHVRNWHIQELRKVVQVQLLPLQFPGSVSVLLQNFLCVLRLESGTASKQITRKLIKLKTASEQKSRFSRDWTTHSNIQMTDGAQTAPPDPSQ